MIKRMIKASIIITILVLIGFYAAYLNNDKKMNFSKEDILPKIDFDKISDSAKNIIKPIVKNNAKKHMYKWRDAKGVIHYTSEKPAEHINVETIELSTETNVVPAISESKSSKPKEKEESVRPISNGAIGDIYFADGIEQLFEQAKAIQNKSTDSNIE